MGEGVTKNNGIVEVGARQLFNKVFILSQGVGNAGEIPSEFILQEESQLNFVIVILPEVSADLNLHITLAGENARADISGLYLCGGSDKVGIKIDLQHNVPGCTSHQLFKGIANGSSKVDFYGKITVAQDAQQTEAYQENHSLLLSEGAAVNTKPQLEIYADDVKCSHGATIGRLDEEELFYMRSRGIPEAKARTLQIISFLSPVLEKIKDDNQRALILSSLHNLQ